MYLREKWSPRPTKFAAGSPKTGDQGLEGTKLQCTTADVQKLAAANHLPPASLEFSLPVNLSYHHHLGRPR